MSIGGTITEAREWDFTHNIYDEGMTKQTSQTNNATGAKVRRDVGTEIIRQILIFLIPEIAISSSHV